MRARGHEVLFLCATDEHGTPAELAAAKAGKPVAEYCAEMWAVQDELAGASASASTISAAPPARRTTR
jgi:methionyl-tRNA synthetase